MAEIRSHRVLSHLRADTTSYVQHLRNGEAKHAGPGLAFWFRPATAAIAEIPLDDREQALLFGARTADFQRVTVQATVNFRVTDPELAATRIDFGIDPGTGQWNATPLETLGGLLTELAQQPALDLLAGMAMEEALAQGLAPVREAVATALATDSRLAERGLAVTDVRVVAIRTDADVERALQTGTRERIQQEADRATFERRALAVERERAIAENELQNQIELARRTEDLLAQQGANERRRAVEQAAALEITTTAEIETASARAAADEERRLRSAQTDAQGKRLLADATAEATRLIGTAEADAEGAKLAAYAALDRETLLALAMRELATNLPSVEHLTITPDLLTELLGRFVGPAAAAAAPAGTPAPGLRGGGHA